MSDMPPDLSTLTRPRLLVQAARIGAESLLHSGRKLPRAGLTRLLSEESEMDRKRKDGEADYSPRRHVDLLIAVMLVAQTVASI
ncbi:DUF6477 family protein [Nioella aestuarii]|uniref:DUF6477 family protein n=1 Tax=Nioella aestuarii TaxID=1662864 RepID=UPI003D7F65D6